MTFHWQQFLILFVYAMDVGFAVALHGKPKTGKYNWFITAIVISVFLYVLYSSGFFGGK